MNAKTKSDPNETCESIKLGIDAHAKWYYVGRQVDGAASFPHTAFTTASPRSTQPPQFIDEPPPLPNTECIQPTR